MCRTSTVQYSFTTCRNNLIPSGGEREGISRAFAGVRVVGENSVPSKALLCPDLSDVQRGMIIGG